MFINFEHLRNREHGKYVIQVLFFFKLEQKVWLMSYNDTVD